MSAIEGGRRRIRSPFGRCLNDFEVGDIYEHWPGRTITEADNLQMSLLTMNQHPAHCDAAYAESTEFGKPLVNSCLTLAVVTGMSVRDVSGLAIANLGWKEVKLIAPVFPGDTLYAQSEVLEVRPSKSRPGQGVVTVRTHGTKQTGETVMEFVRSILVPTRAAVQAAAEGA